LLIQYCAKLQSKSRLKITPAMIIKSTQFSAGSFRVLSLTVGNWDLGGSRVGVGRIVMISEDVESGQLIMAGPGPLREIDST
jgi:hypothetical protein